jgi:transposase InsO family protein
MLCVCMRKFVVTTNSNHGLHVYPNLGAGMVLTGIDQLWPVDITYIRLLEEFVYLAVILDTDSRKGIGWALCRTLQATLNVEAMKMALARRRPAPGLVHHSDRGVQYASDDYVRMQNRHEMIPSMSRPANP